MSTARRPNVVFVLTDDQGYPPLGCHGHPFIRTPNLDAFHGESVRFEQFHTGTTCAPTRSGLMTGHNCNSTGVWHTIGGRSLLRRDEWSLADALSGAGYRTGMFGKWHLGDEYPYRPQDRGFQRVVCHGGGGISQQPDWWGNDYFDDTYREDGVPRPFEGYCTDVFFDQALAFIREQQDTPFFCYISTNAPHGPWNVELRYRDLYTGKTDHDSYARFLGMITNIDENFGRLRETLAELGIEDDTILIFMSDNGQTGVGRGPLDQYNAGMRGHKGSPYDGGHRVPFFVRWPAGDVNGGRDITDLASYIDLMPTVLDLCGVDVPPERTFHGTSLVPLLRGESRGRWAERTLVTDTQRVAHPVKWRLSCVMRDSWRLVNRTELYDLRSDFAQTRDVAEEHPDLVADLQRAYDEWWNLCATQMEDDIPISIGAACQEVAELCTHDLRNDTCDVTWNQGQVRNGKPCNGHWEIMVEQPGTYEIEMRRWPREAGHAIAAGIDGDDVTFRRDAIAEGSHGMYTGGTSLAIDTATLVVSGLRRENKLIDDGAAGVTFTLELPAGPRHLRAQFSGTGGLVTSAFYVYARRIS